MKWTLVGYGTRGDVQPFVALGWALRQRGHQVTLAAPTNMRAMVERAGLPYAPLPLDAQALLKRPEAQAMLANGRIQAFFKWMNVQERAFAGPLREALKTVCAGADVLLAHPLIQDRVACFGARDQKPVVPLICFPVVPSSKYPSIVVSRRGLGPLNRLTHALFDSVSWGAVKGEVEVLRQEFSLPPAKHSYLLQCARRGLLTLESYSEQLFPRPADWQPGHVMTGSFDLPDALKTQLGEVGLDEKLVRWLDAGAPPVYLGFGSMPVLDARALLVQARAALKTVGARGVIAAGWSDLVAESDADVFVVGNVDHAALLARCAAAVHHGGSGTTWASLRAGVPTVVASVFADQPFWGARCVALGVGATLPFSKLSGDALARALKAVLHPDVVERARALGASLRKEDGLSRAVEVLEARAPSAPPPE